MPFAESTIPLLAGVLAVLTALCAVWGTRRLARGLRHGASLDVIRGIRAWCVALAAIALAAGLLTRQTGFLVLGGVFLAEELYETGLVVWIIRSSERAGAT
jgi:hypothetical protein